MEIQISGDIASEREESIRMVSESAAGVLKGDRQRARGLRFENGRFDAKKWAEMAETGWLMVRLPVERDGLGMGLSELCAIARAMGSELSPEPVVMAALVAPALPDTALSALLACDEVFLPAFCSYDQSLPVVENGTLNCRVEALHMAGHASGFLVQTESGAAFVRAEGVGVALDLQETHDGGHVGRLRLNKAPVELVNANMLRLRDEAAVVLSAQLLGIAEAAYDITLAYLKDRKQFGAPIGSFQALQHRMVDLFLELSLARAAVELAADCLDDGCNDTIAAWQASLAKARATRASQAIAQAAVQLHGGIGYTDEADIGLYLRKVMTLSGLLGSERFHRDRALSLGKVIQ